jgi:hydroxymethylglutaryl-CoA lyase
MKLPESVEITEVGPRDGLQNLKTFIPTEVKIQLIEKLVESGLKRIEVTSFVHPKAVPQMADAAEVLATIKRKFPKQVTCIALVPNLVGAKRAIETGVDEICFVISASERHNLENTKQTVEQSLAAFKSVCEIKGKVLVRLSVVTAFTCPFIGVVPPENVTRIIDAGKAAGTDEIMIADTLGTANPLQVESLLRMLMKRYGYQFVLHIHDTRGMGLSNMLIALMNGITRYETSFGGLGGCPFAPGAAGNVATEDFVNMCHEMNIKTGIDVAKLVGVSRMIEPVAAASMSGHVMRTSCGK